MRTWLNVKYVFRADQATNYTSKDNFKCIVLPTTTVVTQFKSRLATEAASDMMLRHTLQPQLIRSRLADRNTPDSHFLIQSSL